MVYGVLNKWAEMYPKTIPDRESYKPNFCFTWKIKQKISNYKLVYANEKQKKIFKFFWC